MSKDNTSVPEGPEPQKAIRAQARFNRIDTFTPFGSARFSGPDNTRLRVDLTPEQEQILGGQRALGGTALQQALARAQNLPTGNVSFGGLPPQVSGIDTSGFADTPFDRGNVEEALFERSVGLLRPELEREERDLRQTLANQGLPIGSEAFEGEFDRFDRQRNEAFNRAANQAVIGAAGQARATRGQQLQEALAQTQLQNRARQQGVSERLTRRQLPFQEIGLLRGFVPGVQTPSPQGSNVDVMGAFQQRLNQQNRQAALEARQPSALGTLASLGGQLGSAAIMASDRRLKRDIARLGSLPIGIDLYRFRYLWDEDETVGVMADEVEGVLPEAVVIRPDGYKAVDYAMILEACHAHTR